MNRRTISVVIIKINLLLVASACYLLYVDYMQIGKFQWVDPSAIADHEELYLTPILFGIALLGFFSIMHETLTLTGTKFQHVFFQILKILLKATTYLYGIMLSSVSFIFIWMTIGNIGNQGYVHAFVLMVSLWLLTLSGIGLFGVLIIYHNTRITKTS